MYAKNRGETPQLSLNFAVLKVGAMRFGLCIDNVIGTEEIVVKPMHRAVKHLGIYSGATVLGDGSVALILDVLGIARHTGVGFDEQLKDTNTQIETGTITDKRGILMFKSGESETFAVRMDAVRRVEHVTTEAIETVGNQQFLTINGISTRVITLDKHINVSPCIMSQEMFLILPKNTPKPIGILISRLVDIGEFIITLNPDSYRNDCISGSAIIRERMTLFLDIDMLLKKEAEE
jgi:two-component system chemotaxis sensor kinase CheA